MLELLFNKFQDLWLVELLFDDLLMWTNWIRDKRLEAPAGLVVLGSDNVAPGQSDHHQCTKTAVSWESGLDNSPMYDRSEVSWPYRSPDQVPVGASCRYHFYDVGMTGLYASMLGSLSNLALIIGRNDTHRELQQRHSVLTAQTNQVLWSDALGIYANKLSRGTNRTSPRISPFNLHPMITGMASEEQATTMATKWLMTDAGFCLTAENAAEHAAGGGDAVVVAISDASESSLPPRVSCGGCNVTHGVDASQPAAQVAPGPKMPTIATCCAACKAHSECESFVLQGLADARGIFKECYLLKDVTAVIAAPGKSFGCVKGPAPKPAPRPAPAPPPPAKPRLGCKYGLPSISHNDSAYGDQDYWRGRTWGPMNFLVYQGLASRRRDCHFTGSPSPSTLKRPLKGERGAAE